MLPCHEYREDFPELLNSKIIYFDNAATTLKPRQVIEAMTEYLSSTYANVHRAVYRLAAESTRLYEEAHARVAHLISAEPEEIVFTPQGTTSAIQLAALLVYHNKLLREGDEIIVPGDAHNSNLLPWRHVARWSKADLRVVPVDGKGVPKWDMLGEIASRRTRVITVTHVSNVSGYESPVPEIARIAGEVGALVVLDGAQSVPHIPVDVRSLGVDFLAFSGHKMLGPTGIGVLWIREDLARELEPPLGGGGTIRDVEWTRRNGEILVEWDEHPWRFEAGTPPVIEAVGLAAAVEYLERVGLDRIAVHESQLTRLMLAKLREYEGVDVIGPLEPSMRKGIVSFTVAGVDPDIVGLRLGGEGIAVRTGTHCANMLYHMIGRDSGSVRASFYLYNCPEEVEVFMEKLGDLLEAWASSKNVDTQTSKKPIED